MCYKQEIGKLGEEIARKYLISKGYKIIETNFSCRQGEIDIIARDKEYIIFIEVKTRSNISYGNPAEAVTQVKRKHILKSAKYYIYIKDIEDKFLRFDVIEVYLSKDKFKINHIEQII